jgi:hypothetical protein
MGMTIVKVRNATQALSEPEPRPGFRCYEGDVFWLMR